MEIEPRPTASAVALRKAKRKKRTLASVFIVESVGFADERAGRLEGDILSQILQLSGRTSEYFYIRTKKELEAVLEEFDVSGMHYLHISCHGNPRKPLSVVRRIEGSNPSPSASSETACLSPF
jgi:hypothetical protein